MTDHIADILDGLVLFQDFSYPELKTISRFVTHVAHKQGEVLFEEGDPGDTMLILAEGKLSIFKGGEHGTQLLSHEGRGRMVGGFRPVRQSVRSRHRHPGESGPRQRRCGRARPCRQTPGRTARWHRWSPGAAR